MGGSHFVQNFFCSVTFGNLEGGYRVGVAFGWIEGQPHVLDCLSGFCGDPGMTGKGYPGRL